jgi:undecaprenyl-diphosphatase
MVMDDPTIDPVVTTQSPSDVLRLAVGAVLLLGVTLIGAFFGAGVVGFVSDLLRGLDELPGWIFTLTAALAEVAAIVVLLLGAAKAIQIRSLRLGITLVVAAAFAAALTALLTRIVDERAPQLTEVSSVGALGSDDTWPSWALAALTAVVSTVGPWTTRRWRRLAWAGLLCIALTHFVTTPVAFHTLLASLAGWTAGAGALVISGSPTHRPTAATIMQGLAAVGTPLTSLEPAAVDARGSTPYFGERADGQRLFVKALGTDERSADLLFRVFRSVQPHDLGDERPFSSLRRAVEHEALVAFAARDLGIRTPRLASFATAAPASFVLAYEAIAGKSLDGLEPEEMTDDVLDRVWEQLALLRHHRVAHRDLRLANVFLADDGEAWIIDFGFAELAASDLLLTTDLAEFLASSSTVVGAERAVAAATRALGADAVATAASRLRLPMLSGATRSAFKAAPGSLELLHTNLDRLRT